MKTKPARVPPSPARPPCVVPELFRSVPGDFPPLQLFRFLLRLVLEELWLGTELDQPCLRPSALPDGIRECFGVQGPQIPPRATPVPGCSKQPFPIPGSVPGQAGWGLEPPGIGGGVPGCTWMGFNAPSQPKPLWDCPLLPLAVSEGDFYMGLVSL